MKRLDRIVVAVMVAAVLAIMGAALLERPAEAQSNAGPSFVCSADNIGATLTRMTGCTAPAPGLTFYITDVIAQSTTATGGQFILRTGTSTALGGTANCATATASLLPSAATVVRLASPGNAVAPTVLSFRTPVRVPDGTDVCVLGVGTNTTTIQVLGYVGAK